MAELLLSRAEVNGFVNSGMLDLSGSGAIDLQTGTTEGTYQLRGMLPDQFSPFLLSACLITGYPNARTTVGVPCALG